MIETIKGAAILLARKKVEDLEYTLNSLLRKQRNTKRELAIAKTVLKAEIVKGKEENEL